jgi:hypothetical protein
MNMSINANLPFWSGIVSGGVAQIQDTLSLSKGKMKAGDYAVRTTSNITGGLGIFAGMEYGALAGSAILPGAGTIIGTIAGAMLGSRFGQAAGYHAGKFIVTKPMSWAGQQKDMAATENDSVSFNQ